VKVEKNVLSVEEKKIQNLHVPPVEIQIFAGSAMEQGLYRCPSKIKVKF